LNILHKFIKDIINHFYNMFREYKDLFPEYLMLMEQYILKQF